MSHIRYAIFLLLLLLLLFLSLHLFHFCFVNMRFLSSFIGMFALMLSECVVAYCLHWISEFINPRKDSIFFHLVNFHWKSFSHAQTCLNGEPFRVMNGQQMANMPANLPKNPFIRCVFFFVLLFAGLMDTAKRLSFINCQSNNI